MVGACIYVALLNRLLLPWYTSDYALEQMADALEQAAALFEKIYISQHNRMRVAALAAGGSAAAGADLALPATAKDCEAAAAATARGASSGVLDSAAAAAELAALEAAEAALHVALRQQVLQRLVAVQMALAKDTVSWRRGVLATPQVIKCMLPLQRRLTCCSSSLSCYPSCYPSIVSLTYCCACVSASLQCRDWWDTWAASSMRCCRQERPLCQLD